MEDLTTTPDRQLEDWLFYADVRRAEALEVDGLHCAAAEADYDDGVAHVGCAFCAQLDADSAEYAAVKAEINRRLATEIRIDDPNEPTLEERLAPWGIEWELEQRDRAGL